MGYIGVITHLLTIYCTNFLGHPSIYLLYSYSFRMKLGPALESFGPYTNNVNSCANICSIYYDIPIPSVDGLYENILE